HAGRRHVRPAVRVSSLDWLSRPHQTLTASLVLSASAVLAGVVLHVVAIAMREFGPEWGAISLRGNGAAIVLPIVMATLVGGEVICARRGAAGHPVHLHVELRHDPQHH